MATFPSVSFAKEFVKVRFLEPSVPESVNKRWLGMPRGVYIGYNPVTTPASDVLTLNIDIDHSFSLLKVPSLDNRLSVDVFTDSPVTLDFSAHNVWPVFVLATAVYNTTSPAQGKIFTRASGPSAIDEVLICKVDKPASDLVVEASSPITRHAPVAFQTQPFGYMPDDSVDILATTFATVAEVAAAHTSSYTGAHISLDARLDDDMSGTEIANRLSLRMSHLISNVHSDRSGSSINVSGSFTETQRDIAPELTIEAGGDETTEGAISDGTRNFCFVIDGTTGQRMVDATTKEPVFGITSFATAVLGAGKEIQFTNASTAVNGNGTNPFQAPLQENDIVRGPDGLFYEVVTFTDPDNAVLGAAFRGSNGFVVNPFFRRWLLDLFTATGGPFTLTPAANIQFIFPCFFRMDRAIFDGYMLIKKDGERPQLPVATTAEEGKALLAISNGLVGSFRTIKDNGFSVGSDFHILNFAFGGATDSGGGVADVSVVGAPGATGDASNPGPTGSTGDPGFGYSTMSAFEGSVESGDTVTAAGPVSVSHTVNWTTAAPALISTAPRTYAHVAGGWSVINGFTPLGFERIRISQLGGISQDESRMIVHVDPAPNQSFTTVAGYMGASQ